MKNGEVAVEDFGKSAPAGEAGMNKGDVILEIDGRKTSELSLFQVRRLFGEVGKGRQIKFRRGDEVHTVNVLLRRLD